MNKFKVAVLAVALAFAGAANAGFYCKLQDNVCGNLEESKSKKECDIRTGKTYANEHVLEWHTGNAFPDVSKFNYTNRDVVCFADAYVLYSLIPQITGLPRIEILESGPTQGQGVGAKVGVVYRGDSARFLIDNFKSIPLDNNGTAQNNGTPWNREGFTNGVKP